MTRKWLSDLAAKAGQKKEAQDRERQEKLLDEEKYRNLLPGYCEALRREAQSVADEYNGMRNRHGLDEILVSLPDDDGEDWILTIRAGGKDDVFQLKVNRTSRTLESEGKKYKLRMPDHELSAYEKQGATKFEQRVDLERVIREALESFIHRIYAKG